MQYSPMSSKALRQIKKGDTIERMMGFKTPLYTQVLEITEDNILTECCKFDRDTGLEQDKASQATFSYIRRKMDEAQLKLIAKGKEIPF